MTRKKFNKYILNSIIFLITLNVICSVFLVQNSIFPVNDDNNLKLEEEKNNDILWDMKDFPELSSIKENHEGSGDFINITLHESLVNTSIISINDTFDASNNSIFETCPADSNFNSSFVNITFDNIYAYNVTRVIEDSWEDSDGYVTMITSFNVTANCYLLNISYHLYIASGQFPTMDMKVFTSVWSGGTSTPGTSTIVGSYDPDWVAQGRWVNLQLDNPYFLNTSKTDNNTWFVGFTESTGTNVLKWRYNGESNGDNSEAYYFSGGWQPFAGDYGAKVHLAPVNNHPNPEDVGLRVNETLVNGYDTLNGSGYWNSTDEYSSSTGSLEFNITADWYNVSCDVTEVIINYTKSDISAASTFNIAENNADVFWNVTIDSEIDDFGGADFKNKYINFTIPSTWELGQAFKGATEKSNSSWDRGDGWQIVKAWDGENGKFWGLNATSSNLIASIGMLVSGIPKSTVYSSDTVSFNATFSKEVAGNVNLSVFSPVAVSDFINYSFINTTSFASVVNLSDWDLSDNVTEGGMFRIRIFWSNDTEVGYYETSLAVIIGTDLTLMEPDQNDEFYNDDEFNITIYFRDIVADSGINTATINYTIDGTTWLQTTQNNGTDGYYNITVDCKLFGPDPADYGLKTVQIIVNKTNYKNHTLDYNYKVICKTDLTLMEPNQNDVFYNDEVFNITIYYRDIQNDAGINTATINYTIDGTTWLQTTQNNGTDGNYNITVDCRLFGPDPADYGLRTVQIIVNKTYYVNATLNYNYKVICKTDLTLIEPNQNAVFFNDDVFNITIYYRDIQNDAGINTATINYTIDGTTWLQTTQNNGTDGYYNITVDCKFFGPDPADYGLRTVQIIVNKTYFVNATLNYNYKVICKTDLTLMEPNQNDVFYSDDVFNITIYYRDIQNDAGINTATINYTIDGTIWLQTTQNNGTDGYYNITVDCKLFGPDPVDYGLRTVQIIVNKTYFVNATLNYNYKVICKTDLTLMEPNQNDVFYSDDVFNITIYYRDIQNDAGINTASINYTIDGTTWLQTTQNNGTDGYYNFTVDCRLFGPDPADYGLRTVQIIVNKTYFVNATLNYNYKVICKTDLTLIEPNQNAVFFNDDVFNITIYYRDIQNDAGINTATINYTIDGTTWLQTTQNNGTDGYYNITIDCKLFGPDLADYGLRTVQIIVNKTHYINATLNYNYKVICKTDFTLIEPNQNDVFYNDDVFNVTIYYKDIQHDAGINTATINYTIDGTTWLQTTQNNGTDGYYNITVDCRLFGPDPADYGLRIVQIIVNKTYYINATFDYNYKVICKTDLTLIEPNQNAVFYNDDVFNITIYYRDIQNDAGINTATINYTIDGTTWLQTTQNNGTDGYYNITVDCKFFGPDPADYGLRTVQIIVNKTYFVNATLDYNYKVICKTDLTLMEPNQNAVFYNNDVFNITIYYRDIQNDAGINTATINYTIDGTTWLQTTQNNGTDGYYNITVDCKLFGPDPADYGLRTVQIIVNKTYFVNATLDFNYKVICKTDFTLIEPNQNDVFYNDDVFNITIYYRDIQNDAGINTATINYTIDGITWLQTTQNNGTDGYYNITVDCKLFGPDPADYGLRTVQIIVNKTYYVNATLDYNYEVICKTDLTLMEPTQGNTFHTSDIFNITIYYRDIQNDAGINGATINYTIDGTTWFQTTLNNGTDGYYNITVDCSQIGPAASEYGARTVNIIVNKTSYENQTLNYIYDLICNTSVQLINITQYGQIVVLNGGSYDAFIGQNITVYAKYINYYFGTDITPATGILEFQSVKYTDTDSDGDGIFEWEVDTEDLGTLESEIFSINSTKTNYIENYTEYQLDINIIHTNITIERLFDGTGELSPSGQPDHPDYTSKGLTNVTVVVTFWDVNHSSIIDDAIGNLSVDGVEDVVNNTASGTRWFELNSSDYAQGEYKINVTFWKLNYLQSVIWLNLSIVKYETNSSILAVNQTGGQTMVANVSSTYLIYRNYNTTFWVDFWNTDDHLAIDGATVTFVLELGGDEKYNEINTTIVPGQCRFNIPTYNMTVGLYDFTITFVMLDYKTSTQVGQLNITYVPTNGSLFNVTQLDHASQVMVKLDYEASNNTYTGTMKNNVSVSFRYYDKLNDQWIQNGDCSIYFNGNYYWNHTGDAQGIYSWEIPTFNINGTFVVNITMYKFNWANVSYSFNLTINPIPTELVLGPITPSPTYTVYDSNDILNITVFYNDTVRDLSLDDATIRYSLNGGSYSSLNVLPLGSGLYNISINCSELTNWGPQNILINATKLYYKSSAYSFDFIVYALTELTIVRPLENINLNSTNYFNITIFYRDIIKDLGISGASVEHNWGSGWQDTSFFDYQNGTYDITIRNWDVRLHAYGPINIQIRGEKTYCENQTDTYSYYLWNVTSKGMLDDYQYAVRGANITFIAYYRWNDSTPIAGAIMQDFDLDVNFIYSWKDNGDGSYTIELNTSKVVGRGANSYLIEFNITSLYNITQEYSVQLEIWNRTSYQIISLYQGTYGVLDPSAPWQVYWGDTIHFNISYYDSDYGDRLITSGTGNLTVGFLPTVQDQDINNDGYYNWTIDTTDLINFGQYSVNIRFNKTYYNTTLGWFNVMVSECPTDSAFVNITQQDYDDRSVFYNGTRYLVLYGANATVYVNYSNSYTNEMLTGGTGQANFNGDLYNDNDLDSNGIYQFELNTSELLPGSEIVLSISIDKTNYGTGNLARTLYIKIIITNITVLKVFDDDGPLKQDQGIYQTRGESNTTIIVQYWNVNLTKIIPNAYVNLSVIGWGMEEYYWNITDVNGIAWITINTSIYTPDKSYELIINISKVGCNESIKIFNITLVSYYTNASILLVEQMGHRSVYFNGTTYIIYRNYNATFLVDYWNTNDHLPIVGANITFRFNTTGTPSEDYNTTVANGQCMFTIQTDNISTTIYYIEIIFSMPNYQGQTILTNITVLLLPTSGALVNINQPTHEGHTSQLSYDDASESYIAWIPYSIIIRISYRDTNNSQWINDANGTLNFNGADSYDNSGVDGEYEWEIDITGLVDKHLIRITMEKANWENATFEFNITIGYKGLSIANFGVIDFGHVLTVDGSAISGGYIGNDLTFQLQLKDNITGLYVSESSVNMTFGGVDYNATYRDGFYYWTVSTSSLLAQSYGIYISFFTDYYVNDSASLTITFSAKSVLNISLYYAPTSVGIGETLIIQILLVLKDPSSASYRLGADTPISGEVISLIFTFGATIAPVTVTNLTLANGIATFSVLVPNGTEYVNITVQYDGNFNFNGGSLSLTIDLTEPPAIDPLIILLFIMIPCLIGAVVVGLKRKGKKTEKTKKIKEEIEKFAIKEEKKPEKAEKKKKKAKKPIKDGKKPGEKSFQEKMIEVVKEEKESPKKKSLKIKTMVVAESEVKEEPLFKVEEIKEKKPKKEKKQPKEKIVKEKIISIKKEIPAKKEKAKPVLPGKKAPIKLDIKLKDPKKKVKVETLFKHESEIESLILKFIHTHSKQKILKLDLIEGVLELLKELDLTLSNKIISKVMDDMKKANKIRFNNNDGWKIKI